MGHRALKGAVCHRPIDFGDFRTKSSDSSQNSLNFEDSEIFDF